MTEIATREPTILAPTDLPSPVFQGAQMVLALTAYRELQRALDEQMPEQLMELEGKKFRKKGYWRAICVAFNLTVEPIEERREVSDTFGDGRQNFGYIITYRATSPGGRSVTGDGSCFAVEKARRFKCPHPESPGSKRTVHFPHDTCPEYSPTFQWTTLPAQATEHNIRSHAHTRAMNRAISNLVGFGEVSAEEVGEEHGAGEAARETVEKRTDGSALVTAIDDKTGQGKNGPWTMFVIRFDDGREGSTFDLKLKDLAEGARMAGTLTMPTLEQKGKYTNLTGLSLLGLGNGKPEAPANETAIINEAQVKKFHAVATHHKWTEAEKHELLSVHGFASSKDITVGAFDGLIETLKARQG